MSRPKSLCLRRPEVYEEDIVDSDLINNLNDDCLARVFHFLPLGYRFRITTVCKRWNRISDLAWETTKSLVFHASEPLHPSWKPTDLQQLPPKARTKEGIERVLVKCGRYLKSLYVHKEVDSRMLQVIGSYCQNLTNLVIPDFEYDEWNFKIFFPRLQYLTLKGNSKSGLPKELFQALPHDTLKVLSLFVAKDSPSWLPLEAFTALQNFKQLSELTLLFFHLDSDIMSIIAQISTLKVIRLAGCTLRGELPRLTSLKNLEELNLGRITQVNDSTLIDISNTCRELRSLDFSSDSVTDRGLSYLRLLPKLEGLGIQLVENITDAPLRDMHNLKRLFCVNCPGVCDDGIITLIKYASELQFLWLTDTRITRRILTEVNDTLKKRTNNIPFQLNIDNRLSDDWNDNEKSPLLILNVYYG